MEKSEIGKSGDGFIDRSKVRILLCDNDDKSSEEVFTLLCKCSYQVTSVKSPRQVIDALNAEGPDIDIILSELDLPMSKGLKMLKYIMRDKEWRRIPVIMMSSQDEVPIVVKCLKLGAADYLVKPLRTNELLNLWTHMWRRRRMLGLVEKNIVSYDFDVVVSDHSDANTNSTTLFSDDTDDKSRKSTNPEACVSTYPEDETNTSSAAPVAIAVEALSECQHDVLGISDKWTGQISSFPKKSQLKIGESSAFFTYVKSSTSQSNDQGCSPVHENTPLHVRMMENPIPSGQVGPNIQGEDSRKTLEIHSQDHYPSTRNSQRDDYWSTYSIPESFSMERSCTPPVSLDISQQRNSKEEFSQEHMHLRNGYPHDITSSCTHTAYSYMSRGWHLILITHLAYAYNQVKCLPQHPWQSIGNSSFDEGKLSKVDRREAALMKFRQKRKERRFDKRIRYVNRKKLAERRPRLRGQFLRKVNGVNVDLNGQATSGEEDEEEEYEEEDETANMDFSPEDDASLHQQ
ncbi:UNVERIFIED_CONTAM: Two-component response regulator-like APRR1 [Sesamum latifolium]|uniref:Two-component response regulator-like APRR1 n=1 Tax=Sesamum latifolium TaxID=2727402 RepID=A0AAW2UYI3_9LAMI